MPFRVLVGDPLDNTPNADRATWAPYIIHNLPKELEALVDTDAKFFRWVSAQGVSYARERHARQVAKARQEGKPVSLYEINHHVHGGTASADAKRKVNATVGGGLDVINSMLIWLKENQAREQCFYASHHDWHEPLGVWAGVLSYRQRRYRPNWLAIVLANKVLAGDLVETLHGGACPTFVPLHYDARKKQLREGAEPLPVLWSYDFAGWVGADHAGRPERPNAVNPRRSGRPVLRHLPKGNSQAGAPQQIGKNLFLN